MSQIVLSFLKKISRYSSNSLFFKLIYCYYNPWKLSQKSEVFRYKWINNYLLKNNKGVEYNHILEIGCGEGHHTLYLSNITKKITSIDVSKKAINRAKLKNIKNSNFIYSGFETFNQQDKFDLVIASEVIYYIKNTQNFINKIKAYNCSYFISLYKPEYQKLKKFFNNNEIANEEIMFENIRWKVFYKK